MAHHFTHNFATGACPPGSIGEREATKKELIDVWFVQPLLAMKGDDAFAALTLCFPLLEAIIRHGPEKGGRALWL